MLRKGYKVWILFVVLVLAAVVVVGCGQGDQGEVNKPAETEGTGNMDEAKDEVKEVEKSVDVDTYVYELTNKHNLLVKSVAKVGSLLNNMKNDDVWFNDAMTEAIVARNIAKQIEELNVPDSKKEAHEEYLKQANIIKDAMNEFALMFGKYELTTKDKAIIKELNKTLTETADLLSTAIDNIVK